MAAHQEMLNIMQIMSINCMHHRMSPRFLCWPQYAVLIMRLTSADCASL